jgi:hypothetical protein
MKTNKNIQTNKIKVNIYLTYPNHIYYEMMIDPHEVIGNLLKYIEKLFPKTKYAYNTDNPIFILIDMERDGERGIETETLLDISKSYIEHNLYKEDSSYSSSSFSACNSEHECSIKIKLKITEIKDNRN